MSDRGPAVERLPPGGSTRRRERGDEIARAVREFQSGTDRRGNFHLLHRHYHPRVERFLARRVYSPEERLDLNQEIFLRIYQGLDGFRGEGSLDGWVIRIAQNAYRKWRDRQPGGGSAGSETISLETRRGRLEAIAVHTEPHSPSASISPLEEALGRERAAALRAAVAELPPRMRRALQLSVYQERSVREIAELLRIAPGTVKAHLFKAREELRRKLEGRFGGLDPPAREGET